MSCKSTFMARSAIVVATLSAALLLQGCATPSVTGVFPGMQFPLDVLPEFWKQMVPDWAQTLPAPNPTVPALSELAIKLKGAVLMSHSQSGIYPFQVAALSTQGISSIVSIEPGTCPSATGDLKPYLKMPILVLWGDYVGLSSRWSPRPRAAASLKWQPTRRAAM